MTNDYEIDYDSIFEELKNEESNEYKNNLAIIEYQSLTKKLVREALDKIVPVYTERFKGDVDEGIKDLKIDIVKSTISEIKQTSEIVTKHLDVSTGRINELVSDVYKQLKTIDVEVVSKANKAITKIDINKFNTDTKIENISSEISLISEKLEGVSDIINDKVSEISAEILVDKINKSKEVINKENIEGIDDINKSIEKINKEIESVKRLKSNIKNNTSFGIQANGKIKLLEDVDMNGIEDGDVLIYDAVTKKMKAGKIEGGGGTGDMTKAIYDTDDNGVVDDAEKVNGLTVETAVPIGAVFTDSTFKVSADDNSTGYLEDKLAGGSAIELLTSADLDNNEVRNIAVKYDSATLELNAGKLNVKDHTHTASEISDFDTEVSNNTDVDANTEARHTHGNKDTLDQFGVDGEGKPTFNGNAVDTTIAQRDVVDNLTSDDNTVSLSAKQGKVLKDVQDTQQTAINNNNAKNTYPNADKNKLAGIEDNAEVNNVTDLNANALVDGTENALHYHDTDRDRANHTGTQIASTISNFDTEVSNNSSVTVNTAKETNATHTGEVTGSDELTVDVSLVSNKTSKTVTGSEEILINDGGTLKKTTAQEIADLGDGGGGGAEKIDDLLDGKSNLKSVFLGNLSGESSTLSDYAYAVGLGYKSANKSETNVDMVAIGAYALSRSTANGNTGIGYRALEYNTTGRFNVASGRQSGRSVTTGGWNVFNGESAGYNTTTGTANTIIGQASGYSNTTGGKNTLLGNNSLYKNQTGDDNTALGRDAGRYISDGSNNTNINDTVLVGFDTRPKLLNSEKEVVIGYKAVGHGNHTVTLGTQDETIDTYVAGSLTIDEAYKLPNIDGEDNEILKTDGNGVVSWKKNTTLFFGGSGRVYLYKDDNRWISLADDYYGISYPNQSENAGTGTEPIVEWETKGILFPKGRKLHNIKIVARATSSQVTDMEIRIIVKLDKGTHYSTDGVGHDSDLDLDVLFSGNWMEDGWTHTNYDHIKTIDLGGYEFPQDAMVTILMRPVGTLSANRYFLFSTTYEIE